MKKQLLIGVTGVVALLLMTGLIQNVRFRLWTQQRFYGKPRKDWKEVALSTVTHRAKDLAWLTNEAANLKAGSAAEKGKDPLPWLSDNLILMRNGEWIVYTNICNKQAANIHDLFIGVSSDGRWYYSDFHFCIGMVGLEVLGIGQPSNVQQFLQTCSVREFDGHSDVCLNQTWDPRHPAPPR